MNTAVTVSCPCNYKNIKKRIPEKKLRLSDIFSDMKKRRWTRDPKVQETVDIKVGGGQPATVLSTVLFTKLLGLRANPKINER